MIDPKSGKKRGVFSYEEVREAEKRGGPRRAAAPLLRRDDARDRPADRLGRDRPGPAAGPRDADRLGARAARRGGRGRAAIGRAPSSSSAATRASSSPSTAGRRAAVAAEPELAPSTTPASSRSSPSCRPRRRRAATACPSSRRCRCRRCTRCAGSRTRRSRSSSAARTATTPSGSPGSARSAARRPGHAASRRPRSATRCTACSSSSTSRAGARPTSTLVRSWYPARHRRGARAHRRRSSPRTASRSSPRGSRRSTARGPSGRSRSSTTACSCTAGSTCCGATARVRSCSTTRRTRSPKERPRRSSRRTTALQRLVYALACFRAGADEVEVVYHFLERPDAVVSTHVRADRAACPRGGALRRDRAHRRRRVRPDAERVQLRRLPGARPRLRRAEAWAQPPGAPRRGQCRVATSPRRGGSGSRRRRSASGP